MLACCTAAGTVLKPFEGRMREVYPDVVWGWKVPTVCDGHTGPDVVRGAKFTDAECDQLLHADLRKTFDALAADNCLGDVQLEQYEMAAYISVAYNMGTGTFCKGSFKTKLKAGDHVGACDLIAQYRFANGLDCAIKINNCGGIVRRREAERALCLGAT